MTDRTHPLIRLWRYAAPHRPRVVLAVTLSVLNKVLPRGVPGGARPSLLGS